MTIRTRIVGTLLISIAILSLTISTSFYYYEKNSKLRLIDDRLLDWARYAKKALPEDYHDRIIDGSSVSKEEFEKIVEKNNLRCRQMGLQYLWSVLIFDSETIVFTTSTSPSHDVKKQDHAKFFELHRDPEAFSGALKAMKPYFSTFRNEWGYGRMVLLPQYDSHGRVVMFGASIDIDQLVAERRRTLLISLAISLFLLVVGFIYSFFLSAYISRPINELSRKVYHIAKGNLGQTIELKGSTELIALSNAINHMSQTIKEDISERERAELVLRRQREDLQLILDSVPAWIFYKDKENRFIQVNKTFCDAMGMPRESLEGKSMAELYPKEQAEAFWKDDLIVINSGIPNMNIVEPVKTSKGMVWVRTDKVPYRDSQGNIIGILGFAIDITRRKKAEEDLKKYHEHLEELVKERTKEIAEIQKKLDQSKRLSAIGSLAAVVAHRLRTPFGAIRIALFNIKEKMDIKPVESNIANIEKKVLEAGHVVDNLLFYSSQLKEPRYKQVNIIKVIENCIESLKTDLSAQKVTINKNYATSGEILIEGDEFLLDKLIYNIINNAYDAVSDKKGTVEVAVGCMDEKNIKISISDNGEGISEDNLGKLFEPFFTTKAHGMGLGLVLCSQIANLHNGSIDLKSEKDKGATFVISLPVKQTAV